MKIRIWVASVIGWIGLWSLVAAAISGVAFVVLGGLKLAGVIAWPWLSIAAPLIWSGGALVACYLATAVYFALGRIEW